MYDYSIILDLDIEEEKKILLLSGVIGKVERAMFCYKQWQTAQEVKMIDEFKLDDNLYIATGFDYYTALRIKSAFLLDEYKHIFYDDVCKLLRNRRAKKRRCSKSVDSMFKKYDYVYFFTYQFYDNHLALTKKYRKSLVVKWLKGNCSAYALNIDFGEITYREHYHAVIGTNTKIPFKSLPSNITLERIPNHVDDKERISKYITKLSSHAVKISTRNERLSYWEVK